MIESLCPDADSTRDAAAALAANLRPGDIVVLTGPLGAGKTTFVQGVGRGLGVRDRVTSPTFTLVRPHAVGQSSRRGDADAVAHFATRQTRG